MNTSYGPNVIQSYEYPQGLGKFIYLCESYVAGLSLFDKYIIWRYTIGSSSINYYLINNKLGPNATYWTYLFFLYYHNTVGNKKLEHAFVNIWSKYLNNPEAYLKLSNNRQREIAAQIIPGYIKILEIIIRRAPKTPSDIVVFKVSTKYPGLPVHNNDLPSDIIQLPFNSTTINPYFNFAPFIAPDSDCCFFKITIPKGHNCLYIPTDLHAYNFEHEILLNPGETFMINKISRETLNYIDPSTVKLVQLQSTDNITIGNVFTLNEYHPCGTHECFQQQKSFNIYYTKLS